jgi:hypothetical protein
MINMFRLVNTLRLTSPPNITNNYKHLQSGAIDKATLRRLIIVPWLDSFLNDMWEISPIKQVVGRAKRLIKSITNSKVNINNKLDRLNRLNNCRYTHINKKHITKEIYRQYNKSKLFKDNRHKINGKSSRLNYRYLR